MKILAMFLPQFHEVKENNEWWGQGFTEWTNIKKKNKFSGGLKPLNDNYYNLLDKSVVEWQTSLLNEYGLYGMCYYHYWFCGRKILEKPAENLLNWKDIPQRFCFEWANHSWYKSWQGSKELLIKQTYGEINDWENHFNYLKTFFLDDRYIKINNKPVFIIFNINFDCKDKMIEYFNQRCKDIGFDGIYFIESILLMKFLNKVSPLSDGVKLREPGVLLSDKRNIITRVKIKLNRKYGSLFKSKYFVPAFNAKKLMKTSITQLKKAKFKGKIYPTAFAMWDSTYRHNERGYKILPSKRKDFMEYLETLKEYCIDNNCEYVFFNAWNEWAEGMTLEPSNKYAYMHLECIKEVFGEKNE